MTVEVLRYSAFTRDGAGGNPAGVVLHAECLTDAQMQSIAQEIGYSETAFVLPHPSGGERLRLRLRYFSPRAEVAFCGHATIATAVALAERNGPGEVEVSTMAGAVTVPGPWGDRTASSPH
jgi:PhzF family phenazine biosynthesis protein